jgi:hypothetical protein
MQTILKKRGPISGSAAAHLTNQAVSKSFTGFLQIVVSLQAHARMKGS